MSTGSIKRNVVIDSVKAAERFCLATEEAEKLSMAEGSKCSGMEVEMDRREISNVIEEWFCEVESSYGIAGVAELFALLYHDAKRNLKYWSDRYERVEEDD